MLKNLKYLVMAAVLGCSMPAPKADTLDIRVLQDSFVAQKISKKEAPDLEKAVEKPDYIAPLEYNFNLEDLKKYKTWVNKTIEHSRKNKTYAIVVDKANYSLDLYKDGNLLKTYLIDLGSNPFDDKMRQGDSTTPEGIYKVKRILDKGQSSFYQAFLINYPNNRNWRMFNKRKREGLIPRSSYIGGSIEIHGSGSGEGGYNWTLGCMALSDKDIDEFFPFIKKGSWITIVKYGTRINPQTF